MLKDMDKGRRRITDVPLDELQKMMVEYGQKHAATVRSARRFLRSVGMKIKSDGTLVG